MKSLVAGIVAGMALIVIKAQIFVMVLPALVLYAVVFYGTARPRRRAITGLVLCVFGAALVPIGSELVLVPGLALNGSALAEYLKLVVDQCGSPAWTLWPHNGHERSTWILLINGSWVLLTGTLAFTERQAFLARDSDMRKHPVRIRRRTWLNQLCKARTMTEVQQLTRESGIQWFLLHPENCVGWTDEMLHQAIARYGNYRVFRFQ